MIHMETTRTSAKIPNFLFPFLDQLQERSIRHTHDDRAVEVQLQELKEVLSSYQDEFSTLCLTIVQRASESMTLDDWCYLCGLLIAELSGELPYPA